MNPNTSLGMRASEHYRREKEAEALEWELGKQAQPEKDTDQNIPSRIYLWIILLLIAVSVGTAVLIPNFTYEVNAQGASLTAEAELNSSQSKGSSSSDGFPVVNMIQ